MNKQFYVYILSNKWNNVLYVGVTSDLIRRTFQHKEGSNKGFTQKYNVHKLVYFEVFPDPETAISREKQLKAGSRQKKIDLILKDNPKWQDLYDEIAALRSQ